MYNGQPQNAQNAYHNPQQGNYPQAGAMPMDDDDLAMDGIIENDGQELIILPKGEYSFVVVDYETSEYTDTKAGNRTRKKVIVHCQIDFNGSKVTIKEQLPLKKTMEWKFCQLFTCIGDRKSGEQLKMNWNEIKGKGGKCIVKPRKFNSNGEEKQTNSIDKFLEPATAPNGVSSTMQPPTFSNPAQGNVPPATGAAQQAGWGNGSFQ